MRKNPAVVLQARGSLFAFQRYFPKMRRAPIMFFSVVVFILGFQAKGETIEAAFGAGWSLVSAPARVGEGMDFCGLFGDGAEVGGEYTVALRKGWNAIGVPFGVAVRITRIHTDKRNYLLGTDCADYTDRKRYFRHGLHGLTRIKTD